MDLLGLRKDSASLLDLPSELVAEVCRFLIDATGHTERVWRGASSNGLHGRDLDLSPVGEQSRVIEVNKGKTHFFIKESILLNNASSKGGAESPGERRNGKMDLLALAFTCRSTFGPAIRTLYSSYDLVITEPSESLEFLARPESVTGSIVAPLVTRLVVRLPLFSLRSPEHDQVFGESMLEFLGRLSCLRSIEIIGHGDAKWRQEVYYYGFVPFGIVSTCLSDALCGGVSHALRQDADFRENAEKPRFCETVTSVSLRALSFRAFSFLRSIADAFPNLRALEVVDCDINAEHLRTIFGEPAAGPSSVNIGQCSSKRLERLEQLTVVRGELHPTLRTDIDSGIADTTEFACAEISSAGCRSDQSRA